MPRTLEVAEDPKVKKGSELTVNAGETFLDSDDMDLFGDRNPEISDDVAADDFVPHPSNKTK
ncbi:MAG: hypothetical protein AMJ78_10135, partial [Omnitrophica WOR_2 bacterium SM23_29]